MKRYIRAVIDIPSLVLKNMNKEAKSFEHFVQLCEEYRKFFKDHDGEPYSPLDPREYEVVYQPVSKNSWPEDLTYEDYEEGDQIIEGYIEAIEELGIFEETSARGGVGTAFFFKNDSYSEELGSIDLEEEAEILNDMYFSSSSKEDYKNRIKAWLKEFLGL